MQNNKKTAIYTERCCIKPFEEADIDPAIPLFTSERVREFLGGVINEDAAREKLNKWISPRSDNLYFSVSLKSGEFIGVISVTTYLDTEKKEISYLFLPEYWGEGYAYESCAEIIAFCKQNLKCDTLIAETQKKNSRSRKLLERLGFSLVEEAERFGEIQYVYQLDLSISSEEI